MPMSWTLLAALVLACASACRCARAEDCVGAEPAVLASVEPRLELRLADGRLIRLAGLEAAAATPTAPDRGEQAVAALAAVLRGRRLSVTVVSPRPDRWGRLVGTASLAGLDAASRAGGVAAVAIAAGLGRYRPEPAAHACRPALLAAEEAARRARLGLWGDPYYSVLAADDRAAVAERAGTDVVIEARLAAVRPGPYRTWLVLAGSGGDGRKLEATVTPRAIKTFEANGVDFTSLIGRNLRLRGLLDRRFGPQIELAGPDDVEVLPQAAPQRPN